MAPELQQILADLSAAQTALRRSSTAFDDTIAALRDALAGVAAANTAQGEAIDAVVSATNKALRLFNGSGSH